MAPFHYKLKPERKEHEGKKRRGSLIIVAESAQRKKPIFLSGGTLFVKKNKNYRIISLTDKTRASDGLPSDSWVSRWLTNCKK